MATMDDFKTTVRNISNSTRTYSFLPPHGRRLDAGEELSFPFDLLAFLQTSGNQRRFKALQTSLENGNLAIVKTPAPLVYDATNDETKRIGVVNGTPTAQDPSWGPYSSSMT